MVGMQADTSVGAWFVRAFLQSFYIIDPRRFALGKDDKEPNILINDGVPMFFVLIAMEVAFTTAHRAWRARNGQKQVLQPYRLNDAIACALLGTFQMLWMLFYQVIGLGIDEMSYRYVWTNFRVFDIDPREHVYTSFIVIMLVKDCGYYWMHRTLHVYHVMWSAHSVHHSGEDYNLPTALRQGALQSLFGFAFALPLAVMGFPPAAASAHSQVNTIYQFWFHTDVIDRLPLGLEYVVNTPMAHRLHHRPPGNCNYGGVLVIWDRMFGTYEHENVRKQLYGLAKQPQTFDAIALNTQHFEKIAQIRDASNNPASLAYKLTARRAKHPWVFTPLALLEAIPPQVEDRRTEGPQRAKWNGGRPMTRLESLCLVVVQVATTAGALTALASAKTMNKIDGAACALCVCMIISCVGRFCDMRGLSSDLSMVVAVGLLFVFFHISSVQPLGPMAKSWGLM